MFLIKIEPGMDNDSFSMIWLSARPKDGTLQPERAIPKRAAISATGILADLSRVRMV
jgi:hypothetical protein